VATEVPPEGKDFENPLEWMEDLVDDEAKETPESYAPEEDRLSELADPDDEATPRVAEGKAVQAEAAAGTPNLIISSGPNSGRKIPLLPMTMTIGREHDNNIVLKDEAVCRYHARIVHREGRYFLSMLDESTGAWVNDERVAGEVPLKDADRIRIGNTELIFDWS